jgi:hypothetical protein
MFFGQDHRHSSMDLGDELVGLPGYDCAGVQPLLSRRIFPTFPETGKDKRRIVFHPDRVWDFASDDLLPFVESIGWNQAAPFLECLPIRGRRINRLKACVDCLVRHLWIVRPVREPIPIARRRGNAAGFEG